MKILVASLTLLLVVASLAQACVYDSECGSTGRCVNGQCLGGDIECHLNIDCLKHGIYFECSNGKCIPSKHKICRSDADCKKNILHRHCKNYRCT